MNPRLQETAAVQAWELECTLGSTLLFPIVLQYSSFPSCFEKPEELPLISAGAYLDTEEL